MDDAMLFEVNGTRLVSQNVHENWDASKYRKQEEIKVLDFIAIFYIFPLIVLRSLYRLGKWRQSIKNMRVEILIAFLLVL